MAAKMRDLAIPVGIPMSVTVEEFAAIIGITDRQVRQFITDKVIKKDGKQSDWPFALLYARIGLSLVMSTTGAGFLHEPQDATRRATDTILPDGLTESTLGQSVADTLSNLD